MSNRSFEIGRQGVSHPITRRVQESSPLSLAHPWIELQQIHGNRHVQRLAEKTRQENQDLAVPEEVEQGIQRSRGGGQALDHGVRGQMEQAFGVDFGGVRIHTGAEADELSRAISARAFTTGSDVFFSQGEYRPGTSTGRELLAHELTHVVQQNRGSLQCKLTVSAPEDESEQEADRVARFVAHNLQVDQKQNDLPIAKHEIRRTPYPMISRTFRLLGTQSWDLPGFEGKRVVVPIKVGDERDWADKLKDVDDDAYHQFFQGFLSAVADPSSIGKNPFGFGNFESNVTSLPQREDIMAFMRALYYSGSSLDLPDWGDWEMSTIFRIKLENDLSTVITMYQGFAIEESIRSGKPFTSEGLESLAEQGGVKVDVAMINNAVATAYKAIDLLVAANAIKTADSRELARSKAFTLINKAGETIKYTLKGRAIALAFDQKIASALTSIFDFVWGLIPGGSIETAALKSVLRIGYTKGFEAAAAADTLEGQIEAITNNFELHVRKLVPKSLSALDEGVATNNFKVGMK